MYSECCFLSIYAIYRCGLVSISHCLLSFNGTIHTDFEKNFIRAEIITHDELLTAGSYATARDNGKLRLEGKDYFVQDGDVILFRHG